MWAFKIHKRKISSNLYPLFIFENKITNNDFNITQKSAVLNKNEENQVPYYGRRHFRFASCGSGSGFGYLD